MTTSDISTTPMRLLGCPESRADYVAIIESLARRGAEAVILGCTEITLLLRASDSPLPLFDTTALHAQAAAGFSLETSTVAS